MGIDSGVNISDDVAPYGEKSAFTQLEHNIVAGYLITAGKREKHSRGVTNRWTSFILTVWGFCWFSVIELLRGLLLNLVQSNNLRSLKSLHLVTDLTYSTPHNKNFKPSAVSWEEEAAGALLTT